MAVSSQSTRPPSVTVYGVDPQVWADFRAWCVSRRLTTGEQVERALLAYMSAPRPEIVTPISED